MVYGYETTATIRIEKSPHPAHLFFPFALSPLTQLPSPGNPDLYAIVSLPFLEFHIIGII